jgi:hypothetical protein
MTKELAERRAEWDSRLVTTSSTALVPDPAAAQSLTAIEFRLGNKHETPTVSCPVH